MEKISGEIQSSRLSYTILGSEKQVLNVVLAPYQSLYVNDCSVLCCSAGISRTAIVKPFFKDPLEHTPMNSKFTNVSESLAYLTMNSKGGKISAMNSFLMKGMLFKEEFILAHTSNIELKTYTKGNKNIGKGFRKLKTLVQKRVKREEPSIVAEGKLEEQKIPKNSEGSKVSLEDAFLFIQSDSFSYFIEKSLGSIEQILIKKDCIVGLPKASVVLNEVVRRRGNLKQCFGAGTYFLKSTYGHMATQKDYFHFFTYEIFLPLLLMTSLSVMIFALIKLMFSSK